MVVCERARAWLSKQTGVDAALARFELGAAVANDLAVVAPFVDALAHPATREPPRWHRAL
jgi:hypothetical protein